MLTALATLHPNFQGPRYRLFRALAFVAAGLSGVAPLIHGINMFGMPQMMRKAFPYTLAKAACLLSGALFYAVSLTFHLRRHRQSDINTAASEDQVSRAAISWLLRPVGFPLHLSRPGGVCGCGPVDRVSRCF